jgi:hypothetical protein
VVGVGVAVALGLLLGLVWPGVLARWRAALNLSWLKLELKLNVKRGILSDMEMLRQLTKVAPDVLVSNSVRGIANGTNLLCQIHCLGCLMSYRTSAN